MTNDTEGPTPDQCTQHAEIECRGSRAWACWYPQMGGYAARAVVIPERNGGCFTVLVWHDGEFPFAAGEPARLHHCDPEQFVTFGRFVATLPGVVTEDDTA